MAKATPWANTDAQARKRGEQPAHNEGYVSPHVDPAFDTRLQLPTALVPVPSHRFPE